MSADRCLEYVRNAGVSDAQARELCGDPNARRCTDALLRLHATEPFRSVDALERWAGDFLACYAPTTTERSS